MHLSKNLKLTYKRPTTLCMRIILAAANTKKAKAQNRLMSIFVSVIQLTLVQPLVTPSLF